MKIFIHIVIFQHFLSFTEYSVPLGKPYFWGEKKKLLKISHIFYEILYFSFWLKLYISKNFNKQLSYNGKKW